MQFVIRNRRKVVIIAETKYSFLFISSITITIEEIMSY